MGFGKSLLIAMGATGTASAAVVGAGLLTNRGVEIWNDVPPPETEAERTLVMDPVSLDPEGYALAGPERDDEVFVSVELIISRKRNRRMVCKLMPRLRAAILTDLGPVFWRARRNTVAEGPNLDRFVLGSFARAIDGNEIDSVRVRFVEQSRHAPKSNCTETLHGGWQNLIKMPSPKW